MRKTSAFAIVMMLMNIVPAFPQDPEMISTSDTTSGNFGYSITCTDKHLIVGAPILHSTKYNADLTAAAYIFQRSVDGWVEQAKLTASDRNTSFGCSVAISGNYAVIGASLANIVYVYKWDGTNWAAHAKLQTSDLGSLNPGERNNFGASVAIDGDWVVVGEAFHGLGYDFDQKRRFAARLPSGSAYVYKREGDQWKLEASLKADLPSGYDGFGEAIAIFGDRIIIGAKNSEANKGIAYIYHREGNLWKREAVLSPEGRKDFDYFGAAVAISDQYAMVGAPFADFPKNSLFSIGASPNDMENCGALYIYQRTNTEWKQVDKLVPKDPTREGVFGITCAIDGNRILVGKSGDYGKAWDQGFGHVFALVGGKWTQKRELYYDDEGYGHTEFAGALHGEYAFIAMGAGAHPVLAYKLNDGKEVDDVDAQRQKAIALYTGVGDSLKMQEAGEIFRQLAGADDPLSYMWACFGNDDKVPEFVLKKVEKISNRNIEIDFLLGNYKLHEKYKPSLVNDKNLNRAAQSGYPMAMYKLAQLYYYGVGDIEKGLEWHRKAAAAGLAFSMHELGTHYLQQNRQIDALEYLNTAARKGYLPSIYHLAELYAKGSPALRNYAKAIELYKIAASFDDQQAAYNLGSIYYGGQYTQQDLAKAFRYYLKAAQLKHSKAMYVVGYLYEKGEGVDRNIEEAKTWYWRAGKYGYTQGKFRYYQLDPSACSICKGRRQASCEPCYGNGFIVETHTSDDGLSSYRTERRCLMCGGDGIASCWNCTPMGAATSLFDFSW